MITHTSASVVVLSTAFVYVSVLVAVNRQSTSNLARLRFGGQILSILPAVFAIFSNRYWAASPQQIIDLWSCGFIFGMCWRLAFDVVDHYSVKRTQSGGAVLPSAETDSR